MPDSLADRRAAVTAEFDRVAQATFASHPQYRSATLAVAQYWDDEADDAVHETVLWSRAETPEWPHECEYEPSDADTVCTWCSALWDYESAPQIPWDDNGESIDLFAAYCKPDCHQDMEPAEAYTPFAIARAGRPLEIVGQVLQPDWLAEPIPLAADDELAALLAEVYANPDDDLPRQVLADWLQDRDDPRGEFIAAQLAGANITRPQQDQLWPFDEVADVMSYARGFPDVVRVQFEGRKDIIRFGEHPAWATPRTLDFGGDDQGLTEAMVSVRRMQNLNGNGVWQIARTTLPVREIHLRVDWLWDLNGLNALGDRVLDHLEIDVPVPIRDMDRAANWNPEWTVRVRRATVRWPGADGKRSLLQRVTGRRPDSPVPLIRRVIRADEWVEEKL